MKRPASGDRQRLRARLEACRTAPEKLWAPDEERVREVLRSRAERLARPLEEGPPADQTEVLVFRAGEERYGLDLRQLAAVVPSPLCSRVPGGSGKLAGVIQVRGEVRPVWDLRRVLGLPPAEAATSDCVLLLQQDGREFGLRVDAVEETRSVRREELRPAPDNSRHATAVTPDLVAILNLDAILKDEEAE